MRKALFAVVGLLALASAGLAGPVGGPDVRVDSVGAYEMDVFRMTFWGGEEAGLGISGDGFTDLDVYVYDANGYLIVADTGHTDQCGVTWNPLWTGEFVIYVVNRGPVFNEYAICVL